MARAAVKAATKTTRMTAVRVAMVVAVGSLTVTMLLVLHAEDGRLGIHVDQRHTDVEKQNGEGDAVGVAAEDPDQVGEQAGTGGEDELAARRRGAGDRVGHDEEG